MKSLYFQEEFPDQCKLDVDVEVGSVEVKAHNGRYISVEVEYENMEIDVKRQGNTLFVRAEVDPNSNETTSWLEKLLSWSHRKARFTIKVPADCEININTVTGKTAVSDVNAPVTIRTITGSTLLANIGGPIYAKTTTGKLDYNGILTDDQHRFEAVTGSICLRLRKEPNAMVDASTTTGKLHIGFPMYKKSENTHVTGGRVKGMLGSGNGRIKAKITTGSLSVLQA